MTAGLLSRLGIVRRQPARSVTIWIEDEALLASTMIVAQAIRRRFPRTPVVFVKNGAPSAAKDFTVFAPPSPFATAALLMRLRTQTLIVVGKPANTAKAVAAAWARGASLIQLGRGAAMNSAPSDSESRAPFDGVIAADAIDSETFDDSAAMILLDRLITRSRKQTMAQRGRLTPGVRLLRMPLLRPLLRLKFREYRSLDDLRATLGQPKTILCLGNGPSSESSELNGIAFDRLFRVNMSWLTRGLLTAPDLVFTGLAEAVAALRPSAGFMFGTIQSEEKILSRFLPSLRRLRYATAERLGTLAQGPQAGVAPTNGALMLATAVALQPQRLIVAGIDLYAHPAGAYPGDTSTANAYAAGHDARLELDFLLAALRRYRGELVVMSEALRTALAQDSTPAAWGGQRDMRDSGERGGMAEGRRGELVVTVSSTATGLEISIGDDVIWIDRDEVVVPNRERHDFAAWLALPIAMRRNLDLKIVGRGSQMTVHNAARLAEIWSRWLPQHFRTVAVSFSETWNPDGVKAGQGDLCLYSGGVDSTYALLLRHRAGLQQSLLTIHGMDYRYTDETRFADLLDKTSAFADIVATSRLFIRTNAYEIYKKYRVNPKGVDIGHAFVLAAAGFLHSETFARVVIAADYRLDQQFDVHPWGTSAATNPYFDDGLFALHTEGEDVTRAGKCPPLRTSPEALASLTFCVDYSARPHNCGKCQKCVRTKAMFVAATGSVPDICLDNSLAPGCLSAFDFNKSYQRAFFFDLHETAVRNGTVNAIPGLEAMYRSVIEPSPLKAAWRRLKRIF